jgi:DNA primase
MPRISQETVLAVKNIPLEQIASPVVTLRRMGKNWRGLSPFTNEKTPSFYVVTDKNIFKCFSSGLAGDGIRFIQETEKLNFQEAVETLAERFNIQIQYEHGSHPPREDRSLRRALLEIHEYATDYFHTCLMADTADGQAIRDYWVNQRGFDIDLAKTCKIGFAPPTPGPLIGALVKRGFTDEAIRACGLFYPNDYRPIPQWNHRFRGRLMIPVRNTQGQVVAFTARQLAVTPADDPTHDAKYVNSPETPIFQKGHMLFNLDRARDAIRDTPWFLLVEGQLDALRCWSSGFRTAVAPQGTAVTEEQMRLLHRYTPTLRVLLDGDRAGQNAALRVLPLALKAGLDVWFHVLPEGADPDSLLRSQGPAALTEILNHPLAAMPFAARALLPEKNPSPARKASAVEQLFAILEVLDSAVARDEYLDQVCHTLNLAPAAVRNDFGAWLAKRGPARHNSNSEPSTEPEQNSINKLTSLEDDLLWIVLQDADWARAIAESLDHHWVDTAGMAGKVLSRILTEAHAGTWDGPATIESVLTDPAELDYFYRIYAEDKQFEDSRKAAVDCVQGMAIRHLRHESELLQSEILRQSHDPDAVRALFIRRKQLNQMRMAVKLNPPSVDLPLKPVITPSA